MDVTRRDFLKLSGGTAVAAGAISAGLTPEEAVDVIVKGILK